MKNAIDRKIDMTAAERAFIDRFVADYCRPHRVVMAERLAAFVAERQMAFVSGESVDFALAAGPCRSIAENAKNSEASPVSPDEEVRFAFASEGSDNAADAWRAELCVPPKATAETMLTVKVRDVGNRPAEGVFSLSGCALPITDGVAEIPFGLFLAGIQNTKVGLCRPNSQLVGGKLLFF